MKYDSEGAISRNSRVGIGYIIFIWFETVNAEIVKCDR